MPKITLFLQKTLTVEAEHTLEVAPELAAELRLPENTAHLHAWVLERIAPSLPPDAWEPLGAGRDVLLVDWNVDDGQRCILVQD